jgi:putative ABC transport system substrate-binding protein
MGVELKALDMRSADDVESVLADALAWQAQAILNLGSPGPAIDEGSQIAAFGLQHRLPVAAGDSQELQAGALLHYADATTKSGQGLLTAQYVDKIIKGARPGDLPVLEPSEFNLVINQTAAHALGLTIPSAVAQQVTQWVQ